MDFNVKVDSEFKVFSGDMQLLDSYFDFLLTLSFSISSPQLTKIDLDNFAIRLNFYIVFEAYPP